MLRYPLILAATCLLLAGPARAAGTDLDAELGRITGLLAGRYLGSLPDPRAPPGAPPGRIYHRIEPVSLTAFGPGPAYLHQIARDGFDSAVPFQQKLYVFDTDPARPRNRMRSFVLAPGTASVAPERAADALARLTPEQTLRFPPECTINWGAGEQPGTFIARVRREDCRYRSERFGKTIAPDLTYVVTAGWLAVEDLLYDEAGESLVPSPGMVRAMRLAENP